MFPSNRFLVAGWALGCVSLVLANVDERLGGCLLVPAGLLLLVAARDRDITRPFAFTGSRTFLRVLLAIIGAGWAAVGVAMIAG